MACSPLLQPLISDLVTTAAAVSQQQLQYTALLGNPLRYFPTQLMVYPLAYGLPAVEMSSPQYQCSPSAFPPPSPQPTQSPREHSHKKRALKEKDNSISNDWTKHQHWRSPKKERVSSSVSKEATYDGTSWQAPPVRYGTVSSVSGYAPLHGNALIPNNLPCSNPTSFYPYY
ncbi:hypothetical protein GCK72_008117 [Caenorhabditis remanei]|uniref:Uncharacterized protein n=1 Tax=Caenorhabditis remanei TaxID=31234 RepID=A0A6A5HKU7_CAERE|nr:hypothetical protein GCK72_008117 [Caenorhabditis remanei]KAF1768155.1 hypothetical protein GCK72_008117 [Caenorhabditis remanei]